MVTSYILDIYYIKSISYGELEKCEVRNTTIDIMPSSQSSLSERDPSSASILYSFGSKVALLPYSNTSFTNTYTVPALGDTTGSQNYTTVEYNVSVNCENPKLNMTAIKNEMYAAQASNGSYINLDRVSTSQTQIIISAGSSTINYTEIFITVGRLQDTEPIRVNSVLFGVTNVSTARCQTRVMCQKRTMFK